MAQRKFISFFDELLSLIHLNQLFLIFLYMVNNRTTQSKPITTKPTNKYSIWFGF